MLIANVVHELEECFVPCCISNGGCNNFKTASKKTKFIFNVILLTNIHIGIYATRYNFKSYCYAYQPNYLAT